MTKFAILDRGYTGHEHLLGVGIIHMNGRLYDPVLHRFLSPDNFVQNPFNTQNFNRYGYVLNNPLKYIDPSGESIFEAIEFTIGLIVGVGLLIANAIWGDHDATPGQDISNPNNNVQTPQNNGSSNKIASSSSGGWMVKDFNFEIPHGIRLNPLLPNMNISRIASSMVPKDWGSSWLGYVQTGLDIVGLIPVVGEIADGANALIYLAQGDYVNAGLSGAAMVPFLGWGATGAKLVMKGKNAFDLVRSAKRVPKLLGTARDNLLNTVQSPKLKNIVNDLYRPRAKVGGGSSMDAFRLEKLTGGTVGGKSHHTKLLNYRTALQRVWKNRANLSSSDRSITKQLLQNIQNALSGY